MFSIESDRFKGFLESHQFDFTIPAIEKDWETSDWTNDYIRRGIIDKNSTSSDLLHADKLKLHLNQIYLHNLAKYVKSHIDVIDNNNSIIYIPEDFYTPNYLRYGGASPLKGYAYYFPMYMTFYLQEKGINVISNGDGTYSANAGVDFQKLEHEKNKLTRSIKKHSK